MKLNSLPKVKKIKFYTDVTENNNEKKMADDFGFNFPKAMGTCMGISKTQ